MRSIAVRPRPPVGRRRHRHLSTLCVAATAFLAGVVWDGRSSSQTLSFDEAMSIAGDPSEELGRRRSALGRVRSCVLVGTDLIHGTASHETEPLLRRDADIYLAEARKHLQR